MNTTTIVTILVIVAFVIALGVLIYFYLRDKTLSEIRADVYQLFLTAEHKYTYTAAGKQKMRFVIQKARSLLPKWAQFFITETLLEKVVQLWFDAVKDLLDDGKYNKSTKSETENDIC